MTRNHFDTIYSLYTPLYTCIYAQVKHDVNNNVSDASFGHRLIFLDFASLTTINTLFSF